MLTVIGILVYGWLGFAGVIWVLWSVWEFALGARGWKEFAQLAIYSLGWPGLLFFAIKERNK